jgi:hypothetical protein
MSVSMSCDCGNQFEVSDRQRGQEVLCPACSKALVVPSDHSRVGLLTEGGLVRGSARSDHAD